MKLRYIGVGEAFDKDYPNTSVLVQCGSGNLLLDCGHSIPPVIWREFPDPEFLDIVYLTHQHADHAFGLPTLLTSFFEEKRKKPLIVCGHEGFLLRMRKILDLAYPGIEELFPYEIEWKPFSKTLQWKDVQLRIAPTKHAIPNHAVRVSTEGKSLCYSGDGHITSASRKLFEKTDLLIHEAYFRTGEHVVHGTMEGVKELASALGLENVDLVHIHHSVRAEKEDNARFTEGWASIPEPGDTREL